MSQHNLFQDAVFIRVKDYGCGMSWDVLFEFVESCVALHTNRNVLLRNLSDLYVLIGLDGTEHYLKEHDKRWSDVMTEQQLKFIKTHGKYILGYMLIDDMNPECHLIDLIDTRLRGYNLAALMIERYERLVFEHIYPGEIIYTSALYWKKYYDVTYKSQVYDIINDIPCKSLNWCCLINECKDDSESDDES